MILEKKPGSNASKRSAKKLDAEKDRAVTIIDTYKITEQRKFDLYYLSDHKPESLSSQYELKIAELRNVKPEPKISSAEKYTTSLHSLQEYFGEGVTFHMCTAERLQEYEDWYITQDWGDGKRTKQRKKSLTSVGINLRPLRHVFRRAIKAGVIPTSLYPFGMGEGLYTIPEGGDDTKQFLETDEKNALLNWQHPDDDIMELYDYAVFSYLAFGINMADIARLRKSKIKGTYISLGRQKTKGRKKKQKQLIIPIHKRMREIIWRRGNKTIGVEDPYVFPILNDAMTPDEKFIKIRKLVDQVNGVLAIIAKEKGFSIKPTTYTMRHTFSWHFMKMGGTTAELQDALGHEEERTTEAYKHGFSMDQKKKFSDGLG